MRRFALVSFTLAWGSTAIAGTSAYRNLILGDGPIVYYELDETGGTTAVNSASTGATFDGTFNTAGGSVTVNQASFAQGGTAYDFGGGFIGAASALTSSLDEWTVEAWVNYDSAKTSASNFLSNDQGGWNDDVLFGIGAENGALGVPGGNVGLIQQGSPGTTRDFVRSPLAAGEWHHVAVTGSTTAGALTLYVDGVLADSDTALVNGVTFNGADGIGTANLTIGAARPNSGDGGYRPYDGLLDEVAVYDKVLDAGAIASHFNAGINPDLVITAITSFASVGGGAWELTLVGQAETNYEFRASTTLDFSPGALVENLTQGDPGDPGTIGGSNDSMVTTDGNGDATVRLALDEPANFVRAQIPPPLFSEGFESGDGGFTLKVAGGGFTPAGSPWEHGDPDSTGPGGTVDSGNGGSTKCWGTNIGNEGFYANPTETCLRSPVIDLTGVAAARLTFAEALDLAAGDTAVVNIIEAATDTVVAAAVYTADDSGAINNADWKDVSAIDLTAVVGQMVRIEWCFSGQAPGADYIGWYIDDVVVTVP